MTTHVSHTCGQPTWFQVRVKCSSTSNNLMQLLKTLIIKHGSWAHVLVRIFSIFSYPQQSYLITCSLNFDLALFWVNWCLLIVYRVILHQLSSIYNTYNISTCSPRCSYVTFRDNDYVVSCFIWLSMITTRFRLLGKWLHMEIIHVDHPHDFNSLLAQMI